MVRILVAIIFLLLVIIFAVMNASAVILHIPIFGDIHTTLSVVIILSAVIGAVITLLFWMMAELRHRKNKKAFKEEKRAYELAKDQECEAKIDDFIEVNSALSAENQDLKERLKKFEAMNEETTKE